MKCPKCNLENLYFIKGCEIPKKGKTHKDNVIQQWDYRFPIAKYLCKDCGLVFEGMEVEHVEKFKEVESTFVDR